MQINLTHWAFKTLYTQLNLKSLTLIVIFLEKLRTFNRIQVCRFFKICAHSFTYYYLCQYMDV